ncbi:MAG: branched-chain amino acid ABC transporter substrate-binding protein [Deltaproteobacteria bacterium]|nr:branched-chain amino acid ABC transporter substrate-binding protein [Deltaproteobacteria bacterium]
MKKVLLVKVSEKILFCFALLAAVCLIPLLAAAEGTIKITYSGPLTGPMAVIGTEELYHIQFLADKINAQGGVLGGKKFEVISLDDKFSVQESQINLRKMISRDLHFLIQGAGSHISHAITDFLRKHNSRNPDQAILFFNMATQDPPLTGEKCNFWHFRFFPNTAMKMAALTDYIAKKPEIKKVYLINQDYSYGRSVQRAAHEMLKMKRPDIKIVGDDLHPIVKIKDFSPYITKIRASRADAVITANWGPDLTLLVKAGEEAGLDVIWYTYVGGDDGTAATLGKAGKNRLYQICDWHLNIPNPGMELFTIDYKKKYDQTWFYISIVSLMDMFVKALNEVGQPDPLKVAKVLEGMHHQTITGEVYIDEGHQLIMPLFITVYTDAVKYDLSDTGMGLKTVMRIEAKEVVLPTNCVMKRPD